MNYEKHLSETIISLAVGVNHDRPRLWQVTVEESFSMAAISGCHGDSAAHTVGPVEVFMDPVVGDPLGSINAAVDYGLVLRWVVSRVHVCSGWNIQTGVKHQGKKPTSSPLGFQSDSPVDFLLGNVRPVDLFGGHVNVERHHVLQAGDYSSVLAFVQRHLSHFMTVCEEEVGYGTCRRWDGSSLIRLLLTKTVRRSEWK